MKTAFNEQSGFTLVEVLVSITILLLVIVGPMKIIARSINTTNFANQQVNAWFLAQEGLELAQKGRDDLVLTDFKDQLNSTNNAPDPWDEFFKTSSKTFGACTTSNGCGLTISEDGLSVNVKNCTATGGCVLYTDAVTTLRSRYFHLATANPSTNQVLSPFTRTIKMERVDDGGSPAHVQQVKVTSTVTWRTGSLISTQKVEAVTYLFNVYDTN